MSISDTEEALDKALTLRFKVEKEKEKEEKTKEEPKSESHGFLHLFGGSKKNDDKKESPPAEKPQEKKESKPAEKPKADDKPKTPDKPKADAPPEREKVKSSEKKDADKEKKKKKDEPDADDSDAEKKPLFHLPNLSNPFGRKIFFPFSKRKTDDTEESDSDKEEAAKKKKKDEAANKPAAKKDSKEPDKKEADKKTDKPEKKAEEKKAAEPPKKSREELAKPESPITQPNKISRKATGERKISGRPEDLPKEEPPKSLKKPEPKKEETAEKKADDGHHSLFNPLNWFRKTPAPKSGDIALQKLKDDANKAPEPPKKVVRDGVPIEQFRAISKRDDRDDILNNNLQQLNALKLRAHPLYKTLIGDYSSVIEQLIRGKERGLTDRLEKLAQQRRKIHEGAAAVETFVDFYVASESKSDSGLFDDYLKLCRKLKEEVHPRTDAISKYLDAIEKEFE